jgi:hypothetical protein
MSDGRASLESQLLVLLDSNSRSVTAEGVLANETQTKVSFDFPTSTRRHVPTLRVAVLWAVVLLVVLGVTITATVYPSTSTRTGSPTNTDEPTTADVGSTQHNAAYLAAVQGFEQQIRTGRPGVAASINPLGVVLRVSTPGPSGSAIQVVAIWTYFPNGQNSPWYWEDVESDRSGSSFSDGGGGSTKGPYEVSNTHMEQEPSGSPNYWFNSGEPSRHCDVAFRVPGHGTLDAPVTNGWFVTVTRYRFPTSVPVTYYDSAGKVVGRGEYTVEGEGYEIPG